MLGRRVGRGMGGKLGVEGVNSRVLVDGWRMTAGILYLTGKLVFLFFWFMGLFIPFFLHSIESCVMRMSFRCFRSDDDVARLFEGEGGVHAMWLRT